MQVLLYIIYGDRTIIGFVDFVANLLNKPTDGATVSVRKRISFRPLVSTIPDTESWPQLTNMCELAKASSKNHGNGIIESKVGLYSIKLNITQLLTR
jgi:hypothetical protein